jgi:hypothetical protein
VTRIELTIPRERDFAGVADLVLAGLASRLDLTVETIDDLQLALETVLDHGDEGGELTIHIELVDGGFSASVGPFERGEIETELTGPDSDDRLGLRRVLDSTVDSVGIAVHDDSCWVELHKQVAPV